MPKSGSLTLAGERGYIPLSFNVAPEHVGVHWDVVDQSAKQAEWQTALIGGTSEKFM